MTATDPRCSAERSERHERRQCRRKGLPPPLPLTRKRPPTQPPPQAGEELSGGARPAFLQAGREEFGPSPFFSPPAGREGPGAGLSARRSLPGSARRFRWRASGPPPDLPCKRERRSSGLAPAFQRAQ